MKIARIALLAVWGLSIGCHTGVSAPASKQAATPPPAARTVNLAIWSNYITDSLLREFERRQGIRVLVSNFSSNEELLAKLQAGMTGFDVIVPSDYMVGIMIHLSLLKELDLSRLPNARS